jgi:hypothetical protein
MDEAELIYIAVAMAVVILATAAAWIESQMEGQDGPDYLRLLRHNPRYREHVARGPVSERRRLGRGRPPKP